MGPLLDFSKGYSGEPDCRSTTQQVCSVFKVVRNGEQQAVEPLVVFHMVHEAACCARINHPVPVENNDGRIHLVLRGHHVSCSIVCIVVNQSESPSFTYCTATRMIRSPLLQLKYLYAGDTTPALVEEDTGAVECHRV